MSVTDDGLLADATAILRKLEQNTPTPMLLHSATAHARLIKASCERARGQALTRRLCAVASEAYGLAAWLYADLDKQADARHYYRMAVRAAAHSGDTLLACYMLGSFGQFATSTGAAVQGLRLLAQARARLPRSVPPIALLWLDALVAMSLARLGDQSALRLFDAAERRAVNPINTAPVWPWLFGFDGQKLATYQAAAAVRLGRHRAAERYFDIAAHSTTSAKQRAVATVERATGLAAAGFVDEACALAAHALITGQAYGSERVIRAVTAFRAEFGATSSADTSLLDRQLSESYEEGL